MLSRRCGPTYGRSGRHHWSVAAVTRIGTRTQSSRDAAGRYNHKYNHKYKHASAWLLSSNKSRRHYSNSSPPPPTTGLFSIPNLNLPHDFRKLAHQATSDCDALRQSLSRHIHHHTAVTTTAHAQEILHQLDDISKTVCNVIDAAELCRCVHSDPRWRETATHAFSMLSDYIAQLNADTTLYEALSLVVSSSSVFSNLSEEERRFASLLQAEFERDGIHLPRHKRQQVQQVQAHLVQLETLFTENITHSKKYFQVNADWVHDVIPSHVLEAMVPQQKDENDLLLLNQVTLTTDAHLANTLGKYSANPRLRKEVYMETMTSCPENLPVLEALRQRRHELAVLQGFSSYADRVLRDKMAQTPANVQTFLRSLQHQINVRGGYRKEMELISQAKLKVEQQSTVEPWDVPFYSHILKARDGFDISSVSDYLTITNCLKGMEVLVHKLFGITMKEEHMSDHERWDLDGPSKVPHDAAVRKFLFLEESGRPIGTMYLDLHPREGKYQHSAHFTVRCGCVTGGPSETPDYQLPVVALVCNMAPPESGSMGCLNHGEVETLFHEFGHALHSLLSRTTFQHLSGTRAAMDFVETPSHLFENFAWDPKFLTLLAHHYQSGAIIPDETVQRLVQSRKNFRYIELQNQVLYSLYDQALFGIPDPTQTSSIDVFAQLHHENHVPFAEGTHWPTRFGHLVTYGACYYGYLYSQVFAGAIWRRRFAEDSLRRESGEHVWKDLLLHGGALDPNVIVQDLLEGQPTAQSFFDSIDI